MEKQVLFQKMISLTAAVHEVKHHLTKDIQIDGVTPVQYEILEHLMVNQPVTPSELSDCQHMSLPNMSRELRKLQEKQLIEKSADPSDRRKQFVRLSAAGETQMQQAFGHVEQLFLKRLESCTADELSAIGAAMELLQKKVFY